MKKCTEPVSEWRSEHVTRDDVTELKKVIAKAIPTARSAHLYEAIAAGLGFATYAGLLAALDGRHPENKQPADALDLTAFEARLQELSSR